MAGRAPIPASGSRAFERSEDLQHAQTIHALLGEHADLVQHIRNQCEKIPIEHTQVERWFDQVNASAHLKPHHVTWRPDYEPYYFDSSANAAGRGSCFETNTYSCGATC
jgi:hypothetical protein